MEKIIFFALVFPILGFVLYLGGSAIMKGFKAKDENRKEKFDEYENENKNISSNNSQEKKNILWLVCEDQSLFFSSYYDSIAKTPNINELASNAIVYDNFFAVSPVCSPSRSSIITGMYPTTIGTQHMRAYINNKGCINRKTNLPSYSAVAIR